MSRESIPTNTTPLSRHCFSTAPSTAASSLHVVHQEAQKFTTTTLPRSPARESEPLPSSLLAVNSGAIWPTGSALSFVWATFTAADDLLGMRPTPKIVIAAITMTPNANSRPRPVRGVGAASSSSESSSIASGEAVEVDPDSEAAGLACGSEFVIPPAPGKPSGRPARVSSTGRSESSIHPYSVVWSGIFTVLRPSCARLRSRDSEGILREDLRRRKDSIGVTIPGRSKSSEGPDSCPIWRS